MRVVNVPRLPKVLLPNRKLVFDGLTLMQYCKRVHSPEGSILVYTDHAFRGPRVDEVSDERMSHIF